MKLAQEPARPPADSGFEQPDQPRWGHPLGDARPMVVPRGMSQRQALKTQIRFGEFMCDWFK
jgi:hypothetical protein